MLISQKRKKKGEEREEVEEDEYDEGGGGGRRRREAVGKWGGRNNGSSCCLWTSLIFIGRWSYWERSPDRLLSYLMEYQNQTSSLCFCGKLDQTINFIMPSELWENKTTVHTSKYQTFPSSIMWLTTASLPCETSLDLFSLKLWMI